MIKTKDYAGFVNESGKDDEKMKKAFEFLAQNLNEFECGRYEVCDGVYVMISEYEPKIVEIPNFEAHQKYIDIQKILSGEEIIKVAKLIDCSETKPYNADKDVAFYSATKYEDLYMKKDDCAIFYPQDAHAPNIKSENSSVVKKAVAKVRV